MSNEVEITDDWWSPDLAFNGEVKVKPRRVLAQGNGHVIYADGGRKTKEVTRAAFDAWIKKYGCERNTYSARRRGVILTELMARSMTAEELAGELEYHSEPGVRELARRVLAGEASADSDDGSED